MSETYNLKTVTSQLAAFGFKRFLKIAKHTKELQDRTMCQRQLGTALGFDYNIISIYMAPPDEFTRNSIMYQGILKYLKETDSGKFLEALEDSNNEHIIEYIKDELDGNPSGSSSSASCSLERKAELVKQHLKTVNLAEFLRPHLVYLSTSTKDLKAFTLLLFESKVISQFEKDECDRMTDFDKCTKLYQEAGKTGYGEKLVHALESSENEHIIEEMYKWIN